MDETSRSSSNIRALRVRVRGTGLGLQGHTPKSTPHKVTFTTRHHPYDVIHDALYVSNQASILRELSLHCGVPHDQGTISDPFPFHLKK